MESDWIVLDRLDLNYERRNDITLDQKSWRVVNNLNANWMPNTATQLAFQYGAKYVRSNFDGSSYTGYTDLLGTEVRRDINTRWDFGMHGKIWHSWESEVYQYSFGIDLGITFAQNMWVSVGYNLDGFDDDDFSFAGYTAKGPYIKLRIKADQDSLRSLVEQAFRH